MNNKCNGWTNHETWLAALWLSEWGCLNPIQAGFGYDPEEADGFAQYLAELVADEVAQLNLSPGLLSDLLSAAQSRVDWYEIAESAYYDIEPPPED